MSSSQLQEQLEKKLINFRQLQTDYQKCLSTRTQLEAQLTENQLVQEELSFLQDDDVIYKLIGPALVQQELKEAQETVNNRLKFITREAERYEKRITELQKKQEEERNMINALQEKLQVN
ncbi:prefoldin subunit 6-like [Zophobas morio]|uniref:prefoldin subunit 6-like n=1 Tax=Zophobas morio TaxID=2755281 RepID=UPI003083DA6A